MKDEGTNGETRLPRQRPIPPTVCPAVSVFVRRRALLPFLSSFLPHYSSVVTGDGRCAGWTTAALSIPARASAPYPLQPSSEASLLFPDPFPTCRPAPRKAPSRQREYRRTERTGSPGRPAVYGLLSVCPALGFLARPTAFSVPFSRDLQALSCIWAS